MFAVIFEVCPRPERWDEYVATAAELRPELERIVGFLENRRFRSRRRPGWLLSLSLWRDEAALISWRNHGMHRLAQLKGRAEIFLDYRLRVGEVLSDGADDASACLVEQPAAEDAPGSDGWDLFDGLLDPSDRVMLIEGMQMQAALPQGRRRLPVRVLRDYGMRRRGEAPQAMPPAPPA